MIRTGKLGIVRLTGADCLDLRLRRWAADRGRCQDCGESTYWTPRFDGDPLAYDMAHIRNRRMYGDTMENTKTLCHSCHQKSHNCNGKPLLRKHDA